MRIIINSLYVISIVLLTTGLVCLFNRQDNVWAAVFAAGLAVTWAAVTVDNNRNKKLEQEWLDRKITEERYE
jgi:hypothetical protein